MDPKDKRIAELEQQLRETAGELGRSRAEESRLLTDNQRLAGETFTLHAKVAAEQAAKKQFAVQVNTLHEALGLIDRRRRAQVGALQRDLRALEAQRNDVIWDYASTIAETHDISVEDAVQAIVRWLES